jgi:uncharacterized RDD family membrane protein YckC
LAGQHRRGPRCLVDEPIRVAPELIGQPLASPGRRLAAFAIDWLVLFIPTVLVPLGAATLTLRLKEPVVWRAIQTEMRSSDPDVRHQALKDLVPFLAEMEAPGMPAAAKAAVEEGDIERAATLVKDYELEYSLRIGGHQEIPLGKKLIRLELEKVIPKAVRAVVLYGVGAIYFTLLVASCGATVGKRLVGIRIVPLSGGRMSRLRALERFIGYLHIPGTLGLAFLDLWHDPNRRMAHDRASESVVLRVTRTPPAKTAVEVPGTRAAAPEAPHAPPPSDAASAPQPADSSAPPLI